MFFRKVVGRYGCTDCAGKEEGRKDGDGYLFSRVETKNRPKRG